MSMIWDLVDVAIHSNRLVLKHNPTNKLMHVHMPKLQAVSLNGEVIEVKTKNNHFFICLNTANKILLKSM